MPDINIGDINLHYEEFGNVEDPALILVMGLGAQMIQFPDHFCQMLADQGFRVIRFDNRDVGLSTKMDHLSSPNFYLFLLLREWLGYRLSVPYTLNDMAADTIGLMDALGVETAHVVGVSMGGMIAQRLAIEHGHRIESVTAIMTSSLDPSLPKANQKVSRLMSGPLLSQKDASQEEIIEARLQIGHAISGEGYPLDEESIEVIKQAIERCYHPPGVLRQLYAIMAQPSMREELRTVEHPVLVIHGTDDPLVPIECGRDIAAHVQKGQMVEIEGWGHTLPPSLFEKISLLISSHAKKAEDSRV